MPVLWRALTKYNCTKCTTTTSTTQFLSLLQDKNNNYACNDVPTDLEWIWNWSFIGQQPYQTKDHWWLIKASNDSFWWAANSQRLFHTSLWRSEDLENCNRLNNNLKAPNLCWNCYASKVHLEFLINVHILEILES